jgi:CheY-like chemotaxis protein
MDVHMPDMNGWTATERIRRAEGALRHTPIIALTADPSDIHRQRCIDAGMDDFLAKPLALEALHAALARWLPIAAPDDALRAEALAKIQSMERGGRGGFLKRLAAAFSDTSGRQVEAILAAVTTRDMPTIRAQCHTLKSSAAHVGAEQLARLVAELEQAAASDNIAQVHALAEGLRAARMAAVHALQAQLEIEAV